MAVLEIGRCTVPVVKHAQVVDCRTPSETLVGVLMLELAKGFRCTGGRSIQGKIGCVVKIARLRLGIEEVCSQGMGNYTHHRCMLRQWSTMYPCVYIYTHSYTRVNS